MEMSFRWYGQDDPVTLQQIREIPGMQGIVTAVYDIPVGEVWPMERIEQLKKDVEDAGLHISVIESVPVHEDIKQGKPNRDQLIENYKTTLTNLGEIIGAPHISRDEVRASFRKEDTTDYFKNETLVFASFVKQAIYF